MGEGEGYTWGRREDKGAKKGKWGEMRGKLRFSAVDVHIYPWYSFLCALSEQNQFNRMTQLKFNQNTVHGLELVLKNQNSLGEIFYFPDFKKVADKCASDQRRSKERAQGQTYVGRCCTTSPHSSAKAPRGWPRRLMGNVCFSVHAWEEDETSQLIWI